MRISSKTETHRTLLSADQSSSSTQGEPRFPAPCWAWSGGGSPDPFPVAHRANRRPEQCARNEASAVWKSREKPRQSPTSGRRKTHKAGATSPCRTAMGYWQMACAFRGSRRPLASIRSPELSRKIMWKSRIVQREKRMNVDPCLHPNGRGPAKCDPGGRPFRGRPGKQKPRRYGGASDHSAASGAPSPAELPAASGFGLGLRRGARFGLGWLSGVSTSVLSLSSATGSSRTRRAGWRCSGCRLSCWR